MSIYSDIKTAMPNVPIVDISDYYINEIEPAKRIYQGDPPWKRISVSGLKKKHRHRAQMNMAKVICDKMATMTFSEQCNISVSDEQYNKIVTDALENNQFWAKFPEFLSRAYALGGGVLKVYIDNSEICIDYVNADRFFPTRWNSSGILDGVFCSTFVQNGKYYNLFEYHTMTSDGVKVRNILYCSDTDDNIGSVVPISELRKDIAAEVLFKGVKSPLFVYFKPAVGNNKDFDVPLGLSIFENAVDTLREIDTVFDSLEREFVLGKKRLIVPAETLRNTYDDEGNEVKYFDTEDEAFQALNIEDSQKLAIIDNTITLRVAEHSEALKNLLNILSAQIGFSPGTLSFDGSSGVKTATEVAADEKDTLRTVQNNKNIVTEVIEGLCNAIIGCYQAITKNQTDYTVSVVWQDNIIGDDNTRIDNNIKLVQAGLKSKLRAIADAQNIDDEAAAKELKAIIDEQDINGIDDMFGGDGDE